MDIRPVKSILEPQLVMGGAGVLLRRSIPPNAANPFDPFLLFDHFAFNDPAEGPIRGFPMHPHRGIETVTYMLDGSVQHRDSLGNAGLIGAGDVQWMTAGGGILHEEMPRRAPSGAIFGFQLWVNLPARLKWSRPRYQEVSAATIPSVEENGVRVRLVAGTFGLARGPVTEIAAEPVYLDVALQPGAAFSYSLPTQHTAMAYVFEGAGQFGANGDAVEAFRMVAFQPGDQIQVQSEMGVRFMLIAGAPRQAFCHLLHQEQVLGTGQNILAGAVPVGVHLLLDIREQGRGVLDFVENHRRGIQVEETARVARRGHADIRRFMRNNGVLIPIEMRLPPTLQKEIYHETRRSIKNGVLCNPSTPSGADQNLAQWTELSLVRSLLRQRRGAGRNRQSFAWLRNVWDRTLGHAVNRGD